MKTSNLWKRLYSFSNLELAYENARKNKSENPKVVKFSEKWQLTLVILLRELRLKIYKPLPLRTFVLRDPKTRLICVSDFRDRVVHHALVNILHPIFEPGFIYDSYASRIGKGTLPALKRFDIFKMKVSKNNTKNCFVLKTDIKQYFETVDHNILLNIISRKAKDEELIWLIKIILNNYDSGVRGKGMPLGNWTSQFFANIYLNELDQFVKHKLKAKYYIRYVDDFVILHHTKNKLEKYKIQIQEFLQNNLKLEIHPNKCKIIPLERGVSFLGFRIFPHHKLVRQRNLRKAKNRLNELLEYHKDNLISAYDVLDSLNGWFGYAMQGNTYKLRTKIEEELKKELTKISENK
ncbi:group II intron reverse transcriptase domain-containing protein [Candidatus Woesearchaeota archaeon]|nr:group II intron reverse transcriptase domain-containing protein [Candidatus Woesearchaeota archaeon]